MLWISYPRLSALTLPAVLHLELAKRFLAEGVALAERDPVRASEKLYKAAEEAVKALAVALGLEEAQKAEEQGRWTAALLFTAVDKIAKRVGRDFKLWWTSAWFLHVEGFNEARLTPEQVKDYIEHVKNIVDTAERHAGA
ncbi:Archaeal PaREP1/PaREP8 family [Pyrobaculum oguniense TE7]|uniref:Archaeal PaREP1/PaREP8 family n=1 Tax=Pyrobaculum oguniense (strain DSM 13380 / JCM 10595 / TE7) TaxID=698757 RepID=H6Q6G0_PYROT|nr:Archaeal PaREP1/PaREP8 family [Pyrobaculum oguniense TE7]